jgi:hypothetical protein
MVFRCLSFLVTLTGMYIVAKYISAISATLVFSTSLLSEPLWFGNHGFGYVEGSRNSLGSSLVASER